MKKASSFLLAFLLILTACNPSTKKSSDTNDSAFLFSYFTSQDGGLRLAWSNDGLTWTPIEKADGTSFLTPLVGEDRLMRDPSICQGPDNTFHMVWTSSWTDRIIGYASSKDLINWSEQKAIPVMMHEPEAHNCWAPELFYDNTTSLFWIFWATTIPGRHSEVAESEREKGLNHRIYAVTTKDFSTFSPTFMLFNPDFSAIDAAIVKSPIDGSLIMTVKNENPNPPEKNIRIVRLKQMPPSGEEMSATSCGMSAVSEPIHGDYWAEGPSPLFVNDTLYVYYDCYMNHRYGAARSTDNGFSWEVVDSLVAFPRGMRHGTAFSVTKDFLQQLLAQVDSLNAQPSEQPKDN